ncbi:MAG: hypothetical protein WC763_05425 [Candidatus Paceibacterota bacterium]
MNIAIDDNDDIDNKDDREAIASLWEAWKTSVWKSRGWTCIAQWVALGGVELDPSPLTESPALIYLIAIWRDPSLPNWDVSLLSGTWISATTN